MDDLLDHHANAIEYVLHAHCIQARVTGGSLSPRLVHFHLQLPPAVRLSRLAPLLAEIAETLQVPAVRLAPDPDTGSPVLEVPRPDPMPVRLLPLARKLAGVVPDTAATLGLDTAGMPLLLRLSAGEVSPVLVAGARGAGKSGLVQTMAISLALHNSPETLRLLLLDLSGPARYGRRGISPWAGFDLLPHLVGLPVREPQEAQLRLRWVGRLLHERAELVAAGTQIDGAALVVIVDGLEELTAGPNGPVALDLLDHIAREGRALGVYLVATSGGSQLLAQLPWGARLVGRCKDAAEARAASGLQGSGAEGLLGEGDFLVLIGAETLRFQAACLSADEARRTAGLLQRVAESESPSAEAALQAARPAADPPRGRLLGNHMRAHSAR